MRDEPVRCGIVAMDIEGFNRHEWTNPIRQQLRTRLRHLVDQALTAAAIDTARILDRNDTGDGLLLLIDNNISPVALLQFAVTHLTNGLDAERLRAPVTERMRLRVVVREGLLLADAEGYTGADLNHAFRLLNAQPGRDSLANSPAANAVVLVPDEFYDGIVRHGYKDIDPAGWQQIAIRSKETETDAWLHLPGLTQQPTRRGVQSAPPRARPRRRRHWLPLSALALFAILATATAIRLAPSGQPATLPAPSTKPSTTEPPSIEPSTATATCPHLPQEVEIQKLPAASEHDLTFPSVTVKITIDGTDQLWIELSAQIEGSIPPGAQLAMLYWTDPTSFDSALNGPNRGNGLYYRRELEIGEARCALLGPSRIAYPRANGLDFRFFFTLVPDASVAKVERLETQRQPSDSGSFLDREDLHDLGLQRLAYFEIKTDPIED
jgi:hypothetical protein